MKQIKKLQIELNGSIGLKLKKNYQSHRYEEVIEFIERLEKICKLKMELAKKLCYTENLFENFASKNLKFKN